MILLVCVITLSFSKISTSTPVRRYEVIGLAAASQETDSRQRNIPPFKRTVLERIRRLNDSPRDERIKAIYDILKNNVGISKVKKILRQNDNSQYSGISGNFRDEFGNLIESELQNALAKKSSALLDRPFVQNRGNNEFLVLKPELIDPFVTVVPNDIYYNSEKKCVNWLEDCNAQGIRARLLQKVLSPYK